MTSHYSDRPRRVMANEGTRTTASKMLRVMNAMILAGVLLIAGSSYADEEGIVLVKCQEKVNLGDAQRDVPPQVYQYQASADVARPASCIPLPNDEFPEEGDGGRSCAQCLSDLISDEGCGLQGSPVVVLPADPDRGDFRFRSVEKYTLACVLDDD